MQRTTIMSPTVKRRRDAFISCIVKNNGLLLVFIFLISGLLIGSLSNKIGITFSNEVLLNYLTVRQNSSFFTIFLKSFYEILPFIAICFFAGTCMAGSFIVPFVLCYRGFLIGSLLGHLYLTHGLYGIVFNVILIIPAVTVSSIGLVLMAREAFLFSLCLMKLVFPGKVQEKGLFQDFILYCKRQLILILLFVLSSIIDAAFSCGFISFFNF